MNRFPFKKLPQVSVALLLLPMLAFTPWPNQQWDQWLQPLQGWTMQNTASSPLQVHLSQPFYASGDTVRFAAYVTADALAQPEGETSLVQVEVRGLKPEHSRSYQFALKEGVAQGAIPLADSLPAGEYEMVTYAASAPRNQTSTVLRILGPVQLEMADAQTLGLSTLQVQAYPEGGSLVAGAEGLVAVQVTGSAFLEMNGKVLDGANKTVATFKTDAMGKALVKLTPATAQTHKVQVIDAQGRTTTTVMPVIASGIALQVNPVSPTQVRVRVQPNLEWTKVAGSKEVLVSFMTAGAPVQSQKISLTTNTPQEITFQNSALGQTGQVVVLNSAGKVEASRTLYLPTTASTLVALKTDRQRYGRREKVTVTFTGPASATLSMAVQNQNYASTPEAMEWEMRKLPVSFKLQEQVTAQMPVPTDTAQETIGAKRGVVVDASGKPLPGATIMFMGEEEAGTIILNAQQDGSFVLSDPNFTATSRLIYDVLQLGKRVDRARVQWQAASVQKVSRFKAPLVHTHQEKLYLQQAAQRKLLSRAFTSLRPAPANTSSLPSPLDPESIGAPDRAFDLTKYVAFKNVEEVIKEVLPITSIVNTPQGREPRIFSLDLNTTFKEHPLFIVNGYPTFNTQWVLQLPGDQLEKIGLYYSTARLRRIGQMARNGVISITTLNKELHPDTFKDDRTFSWDGVAPVLAFKAPAYEVSAQERVPDFRSLMYWSPSVKLDAKGQATVSFYTSDDVGPFVITVKGRNAAGQLVSQTHTFHVAAAL
ncbi:hypothetical protein [Nibribacter koreensis]|uniref:MG2 domain-containing protein n=1 Tax=Nibribacter koreensis TaxID=1084519 RepID=A0ABP8FZI4_9BACT